MLTPLQFPLFFILIGLCLSHYVSASWSIWSLSWKPLWVPAGQSTNDLHCKRARQIFIEYCDGKETKRKRDMSQAFINCFLNQAGGKLEWDESQDYKDPEQKYSNIMTSALTIVDMLCSNDESILQSSLKWFNGDDDISRSLRSLSNGTKSAYREGKRVQKLFSHVSETARHLNSFAKDLAKLRTAYIIANASTIHVPDFAIIHDEFWIMVQDTVDLFASHLHMISYFKTSLRKDLNNMEKVDKTLEDVKELSLFWRSYKRGMERLSEVVVRNKAMRARVLHPWLFKEKRKIHISKPRGASQDDKENAWVTINSELRDRFRVRPQTVLWLLYDNMELSFRAYVRFAFQRLMRNAFESSSWPNWMLLASSLLAHLLTFLSVILRLSVWLARRGTSLILFFVQFKGPRILGTSKKRKGETGLLEEFIRLCVKENLESESETAQFQVMLHSVCQRELDISISKLRSVEKRMLALCRDMKTLQERAESVQYRVREEDL